jgi:gentisate 1,2-dioxygenase
MSSESEPPSLTAQFRKRTSMDWEEGARFYEYTSAANPQLNPMPFVVFPSSLHRSGETRVIPFDLSTELGISWPATSPNLFASFLRIKAQETLDTQASATSQLFYVINGSGKSTASFGAIDWSQGDLFVLPMSVEVDHKATTDAALYWVHDEPLLTYLGVQPGVPRFKPTLFRHERMMEELATVRAQLGAAERNRMGILLGNEATPQTMTITHMLWSLLNILPANKAQKPHRHNSVALDLCVSAESSGVYTLMGPELNADGTVKNPIRAEWESGAVFTTPPGWWHSHHNETGRDAVVLPIQDAGLHTWMRTLDIRFVL